MEVFLYFLFLCLRVYKYIPWQIHSISCQFILVLLLNYHIFFRKPYFSELESLQQFWHFVCVRLCAAHTGFLHLMHSWRVALFLLDSLQHMQQPPFCLMRPVASRCGSSFASNSSSWLCAGMGSPKIFGQFILSSKIIQKLT